ncbi:glycine zipper 2TM domain-containing protein [Xylophilus sp. Kf1]|nr:glycine zipper 2TM domain-containing protein [Xylophilus sp. Kf1]
MDPVFDNSPGQKNAHAPVGAPPPGATGSGTTNRPLWAAIGVLGVAVAALGGTLLWQNVHGGDGAPTQALAGASTTPAQALSREDVLSEKTPAATVASAAPEAPATVAAPVAPKVVSRPVVSAPKTAGTGYTGNYGSGHTAQAVARAPVCGNCGRVESVTPIQEAAPASGLGAVAGGVLGAVLGNQVGHGNGRAAATLLGAGGGAYLGNTVEKRTRTATTYQIRVRMDDGSVRTYNHTQAVPVGERVTTEGNGFRLGQAATYSTVAARDPYYQPVSEPQGSYSSSRY